MNLTNFEHHFIRTFKFHLGDKDVLGERKFLVAVSGGADSIALALLFHQFQPMFQYQWRICYVHHGTNASDPLVIDFRNRSKEFVKKISDQFEVEFITNDFQGTDLSLLGLGEDSELSEAMLVPSKELKSEEELREFRYKCFKKWLDPGEILVLGHHLEDQLETQLMDLLRGSHFHHWENFKVFHKGIFRPLSQCGKKDILDYLHSKEQKFIDDPSNADIKITRNWIRHELFSALEQRFPSSKFNLSQNLKKLYEYKVQAEEEYVPAQEAEISLTQWMLFSYSQKQKFVLNLHLSLAQKSLTQGQILEVIKQLDQRQKDIRFQTGPIFWMKNAEKIIARRENL